MCQHVDSHDYAVCKVKQKEEWLFTCKGLNKKMNDEKSSSICLRIFSSLIF